MITGLIMCAGLIGTICLSLRIYGYFEGETLILDALDEWRLSRLTIRELDAAARANPNRCDVIISLSTIPSRIALMEPTIKSLLRQQLAPQAIIINVPDYSLREDTPYQIPDFLRGLRSVILHRCKDQGPATKYLPTVLRSVANQRIIIVDDDRIYPPTLVAELTAAMEIEPGAVYCMSGWHVPADLSDHPTTIWANFWLRPPVQFRGRRLSKPTPIDMVMGYAGYIIRPEQIDLEGLQDFSKAPREAFFVDDVWISAHCLVPRFALPTRRFNYQSKWRKGHYDKTALAAINKGPGDSAQRNNTVVLRIFPGRWLVEQQKRTNSRA